MNVTKKNLLILVVLLTPAMISVQDGGTIMKRYGNQLSQVDRGNVHVAYQGEAIGQVIYDFMEGQGTPGMTLAIVQALYISRVVGYRVADLMKGNLTTAKTLWPIGPISQGYVAVAVMQPYERGKFGLNDPIGEYLKDVPGSWKPISILQLTQHSSGIADCRTQKGFDVSVNHCPEQLIETVAVLSLTFEPGTGVKQSATSFLLLTSITKRAGKVSYHDFVKKCRIGYLGLQQTFFGKDLAKVKQEDVIITGNVHQTFKKDRDCISPSETTTGCVEKDDRLVTTPVISPTALKGFSDTWASAENVSHWDIGLAENALIEKPEDRNTVYEPTRLANSKMIPAMASWQFYNHNGPMNIKGDVSGHPAFLSRFTDASKLVCVTLLANKEGVDLTDLGRRIAVVSDSAKMDTGANDNLLYTYESQFSVDETMGRIEQTLRVVEVPVFAKFDHGRDAEEVGPTLRPSQVTVLDSPKVGTKLMQDSPSISIELSLKIPVWEDKNDSVQTTFLRMQVMAAEYGLEVEPVVGKIQELLKKTAVEEASAY